MNKIMLLPLAALILVASAAGAAPTKNYQVPETYHLLQKVTLGGVGRWDYLTVDPDARRVYISRGSHVMVVDADTYKIVGDIPNTAGVHGIALAPELGRGFTSNGSANSVTIFDLKTLKTLGTVAVGNGPDCIIYEPKTMRVFTFNGRSNDPAAVDAKSTATVLDAKTGKVVGTIMVGGRPEFAVADGAGMVYNNIETTSEVIAIDAKSLTVKKRWSLAPAASPSGIAMDTKNRLLFSTCDGGKMAISDPGIRRFASAMPNGGKMAISGSDTGMLVNTAPIGNGPDAAEFDPGTGLAFSSNGQDGTLSVLRSIPMPLAYRDLPEGAGSLTPVQTVPTQVGARTMALDTKTHRVFLVTATPDLKNPGVGFRRNFVPGSFTLLVLGP